MIQQDPLNIGLTQSLPIPGTEWSYEKRFKWLKAAISIFDIVYKESPEDMSGRKIIVELKEPDHANTN